MNDKIKKIDKRIVVIYVVVILLIIVGIAYALKEVSYAFNTDTGVYGIDETAYGETHFNSANLDLKPILDSDVTTKTDNVIKIDFTVGGAQNNPNDRNIIYDIALNDLDVDCDLLSSYVKWKLVKNGEELSSGNLSNSFDTIIDNRLVLTSTQVDLPNYSSSKTGYDNYSFYLWLSDSCQSSNLSECMNNEDQSSLLGKSLSGKIEVELNTGVKKTNTKHPSEGDACSNIQKVLFDPMGGEVSISSKEVVNGEAYGTLPTPIRENYSFDGWYLDKSYTLEVVESSIVNTSDNIVLYAKWVAARYNITYNLGNCTTNDNPSTYSVDTPTFALNDPICPGYTFNGWTGSNGNVPSKNVTIPKGTTGNKTYNVNITPNIYDVTYDYATNGGTSATKTTDSASYGSSIDLTPTATKSGWTFVGWNTDKDATSKLDSLTMGTSNVTLYAIYRKEAITYTATTQKNVSSATGTNTSASCTIAAVYNRATQATSCEVTLPSNPYTLTNWTFNGWVNAGSATTTTTTSGAAASSKMSISGNVNIVATWKKTVSVKLTFDKNGGTANTTSAGVNTTLYNGSTSLSATLTFTAPSCTTYSGWNCAGYNTSPTATSSSWNVGATKSISVSGTVPIGDETFTKASGYYHIWKKDAKTYTATTQKNVSSATGTGTSVSCTIAAVYNGDTQATSCEVTLPSSPYTLTNWTFNGWVNAGSATTTTTTSGAAASSKMSISSNINIVATWKKTVSVKLTFDKNGGTADTTSAGVNTTLYNGSTSLSATLTFTAPSCTTYSGWTCVGYNTSSTATSSSWDVGATKSIAVSGTVPIGDKTFTKASGYHHIWKKTSTATFYYYNGSAQTSTTASCSMYNSATSCTYSLPSAVSGSSGPSSTTYKGVSTSTSSTTTTTSYTSSNTKYYAVYQKAVTATFYYNSNTTAGNLTVSTATASGNRNATTNGTTYSVSEGSITVPSAVSNSVGKYNTPYYGVANAVNSHTTSTVNTSKTTYYAIYGGGKTTGGTGYVTSVVNIYYPSSSSSCSKVSTAYRNEYFTSASAMTSVIGTSATATSNLSVTITAEYTFKGFATAANSTIATYSSVSAAATSTATTLYAHGTKSVTSTFYYSTCTGTSCTATTTKSSTASGNKTNYCTSTSGATLGNSTITAPVTVTSLYGPYSTRGVNWTTSTSSSSAATLSTANTTYYAYYSGSVTLAYPSSTNAASTTTVYRNAYLTSTSSVSTVIGTSNTTRTALSSVSGILGTFKGYTTTVNSTSYTTPAVNDSIAKSTSTTVYAVSTSSVSATFYYSSCTATGCTATTTKSSTASGDRTNYCTSTSAATTKAGTITAPVTVTSLYGPYSTRGVNWTTSTSSSSAATLSTATTTYYAYYSGNVTLGYPTNTSGGASSTTVYRNAYLTSTSSVSTVIGTSNTTRTALSSVSGIQGTFKGYTATANSTSYTTPAVNDSVAKSTSTTIYAVSSTSVSVTFYYYAGYTRHSTTGSGDRLYYCSSTSASKTSNGTVTIPDVVKRNITEDGNTYTYRGVVGSSSTEVPSPDATVSSTATTEYPYWNASYSVSITITYDLNGGSGTVSNVTETTYMNSIGRIARLNIKPASGSGITKTNYVFNGWNTASDGTGTSYTPGSSYSVTSSITLYAQWLAANYEVSGSGVTTAYFMTLADAHSYASAGNTVKVLKDVTEEETIISKNLTLNTNSKTMTINSAIIVDSGTLTVNGSGTLKNYASDNRNIIYLTGGSASLSSVTLAESGTTNTDSLVNNSGSGSVTLDNVTANISTSSNIFYCPTEGTGSVTINSGTYNANAKTAVRISGSCATTIAGGTLTATSGYAVRLAGSGTLNVTGGTIQATGAGYGIFESGSGNVNLSGGTIKGTASNSKNAIYMSETSSGTLTLKGADVSSASTSNYAISINRNSFPSFSMTSGTITCNATGGCLRIYKSANYLEGDASSSYTISGGTISSSSGGTAGDDTLVALGAVQGNLKITGGVIANYAEGSALLCSYNGSTSGDYDVCYLNIEGGTMYAKNNSGYGAVRVNLGTANIGKSTARILAKSAYALYVTGGGVVNVNYDSTSGSGLAYNKGAVILSTSAPAVYVTNNAENIARLGTRTYAYKASDGSSVPAPRISTGSSSAYTLQCGSSATCQFRGGRIFANSKTVSHLNSGFTTYSNASGTYKTTTASSGTFSYGSGSYAVTASYKSRGYYGT